MLIYSDSVIVIYYLEGMPAFKARATARLNALSAAGDTLVISDRVRLECRVLPIRHNEPVRLADFDLLFSQPNIRTRSPQPPSNAPLTFAPDTTSNSPIRCTWPPRRKPAATDS
jgi:hypothetical protein